MSKYKFDDPAKAYAEALSRIRKADKDGATELGLSSLGLTSVPPEIGQLAQLTTLYLQVNQLTSVPPEIGKLVKLTNLVLATNQLTSVPPEIGQLAQLTELHLYKNRLSSVPPEIWQLAQLNILTLYENQLTSVPPEIGKLAQLTRLDLNSNQLASVPPEIGKLPQLTTFEIHTNQLTSVPPEIGQLDKLTTLNLKNNPLNDGMQAAYDRGRDEFLAYLRSLERDAEPLYEAKLVLVGEGAVGKTSLLDALQGRDFVAERATTHGIEIATEPLDLPHPQITDTNIRLNCWDFGGQPVYRVTHQFFFSRRSLYLLLWSPRMSPDQCDVEGWIKRIKLRVGEGARIIVVATHAKTGERIPRINESALRRDHRSVVVDFCEIDSKTGYGIDELKTLIAETAAQLPQMGNAFNAHWKAARDEVIELAKTQPRLGYSRFAEICESHELDEIATTTLADFMDILGYVVYFGDDQNLKEEMILQPQWLAKAIGYVLEDPDTNASRGELQHAWLHDIWYDHGKEGFERYDPELHPYFLRLMEKFNVSYRLEGGESSLVAELVPKDRPELPWLPDQHDGDEGHRWLSLVCQMNEAPPGLVPWLIVGAHRFATEPRRHWQEGMYLAYEPHGSAVVELRDRELQIDVRADFPSHFMSVLSDHLTYLIRRSWRGLDYDLAVPCPQIVDPGERCEGRFELDALRDFKAEGDETIRCQKCRQRQQIDKMLFGFDTPGLLAGTQAVKIEGDMSGSTIILGNQNTASAMQRIERAETSSPSEAADLLRVVLRAMNAETRDCPRLFTLIPRQLAKWKPKNLGRDGLRMTLWCEMPDCEHATCKIGSDGPGEYTFTRPQEWLVKVAPYAKMISTLLSVAAPIAAASVKAAIGPDTLADVGKSIDVMKEVVSGSLKLGGELAGEIDEKGGPRDADGYRSSAEGAGLRELHSLLLELDPAKTWGNLRRVLTPTGDYLWLCPTHYREYDPGLPVLPKSSDQRTK